MKNVDIIHDFANNVKFEQKNDNISYYDNTLYSYSAIIGLKLDSKTIVINDTYYSVTTNRHQSILTGATKQYKQLFLTEIQFGSVKNNLKTLILSYEKAKSKKEYYKTEIYNLFLKFNENVQLLECNEEYLKLYKHSFIFPTEQEKAEIEEIFFNFVDSNGFQDINFENMKLEIEKHKKRVLKEQNKRKKLEISKFYYFKIDYVSNLDNELIRINKDKQQVETTQGVVIDFENAVKFYDLLCLMIQNKKLKSLENKHFLNYRIIKINPKEIQIGCHNFLMSTLLNAGKALKSIV